MGPFLLTCVPLHLAAHSHSGHSISGPFPFYFFPSPPQGSCPGYCPKVTSKVTTRPKVTTRSKVPPSSLGLHQGHTEFFCIPSPLPSAAEPAGVSDAPRAFSFISKKLRGRAPLPLAAGASLRLSQLSKFILASELTDHTAGETPGNPPQYLPAQNVGGLAFPWDRGQSWAEPVSLKWCAPWKAFGALGDPQTQLLCNIRLDEHWWITGLGLG